MRRRRGAALATALAALAAVLVAAGSSGAAASDSPDVAVLHASNAVEQGTLKVVGQPVTRQARLGASAATATGPAVGDQRSWLGLDDTAGAYFFDSFTLRAVGQHIEVWVQDDTTFPAGDCRNDTRVEVTDAQVAGLVNEFDSTIYPKESKTFSVPPSRDGSDALLAAWGVVPPGYYGGDGDKIVTLVENVRDDNFFDTNNQNKKTYIAGFFSMQLNAYFGRNVMTIDAFDWLHRTGANPPDNPSSNACTNAPARPHLYEGTFAHEYQHLLESDQDPDEANWVNEGLSDWAQTLVGYVDPALPVTERGFDSHIQCFLGWLTVQTPVNPIPRPECGPENSLTRWLDLGDPFVLADYGAAYSMMELLQSRYGNEFMTGLHRNPDNGLAGLQSTLDSRKGTHGKRGHGKVMAQDLLHDWALAAALDGLVDGDRYHLAPGPVKKKSITVKTLDSTVNWDDPYAYASPGAPSNGADYVRLRDGAGNYLAGDRIDSLSFSAAKTLAPQPVQWSVVQDPTTSATNPVLYSGADDYRDEAIVTPINVPTGAAATLTFRALWNEEEGWDFGFVQISEDGGATYRSLACTDTTTSHDPDALPTAADNVPGFTGYSGTFRPQTCSLAGYAGKAVLLAFRAFNDPATLGTSDAIPPGFWVDDVKVGTQLISNGSSLAGWKSFTETKPNTVAGFSIWIVSIDTKKRGGDVKVQPLELNADFSIKGKVKVQKLIDKKADFVGAIVFYDDPSETSFQYAPYTLTVNGVVQPGGS